MREIKFRTWDTYDYPIYKSKSDPDRMEYDVSWPWQEDAYNLNDGIKAMQENDNKIFMQFTGLKDKNGKEIYEGDLIKITDEGGNIDQGPVWYVPKRACYCIVWHEGESSYSLADNKDPIEVIGNTYENPDY